jgi:hypothetical protein
MAPDGSEDDKRIRFPRFGTGEQIAELMLLAWARREVQIRDHDEFTEIVFRIPVKREFKKWLPVLHGTLFGRPETSWASILDQAYRSDNYGGKPLSRYIDSGIRSAYFSGMKMLVESAKGAKDQKYWSDQIETAVRTYEQEARTTPGPQPSLSVALDILERYESALGKVKSLRSLGRPWVTEDSIEDQIDGLVAPSNRTLVLRALGEDSERQDFFNTFYSPDVQPRDLTLAIVECDLKRDGHDLGRSTIVERLTEARAFIKKMAAAPPPPNLEQLSSGVGNPSPKA